jgi:hypothetical protein
MHTHRKYHIIISHLALGRFLLIFSQSGNQEAFNVATHTPFGNMNADVAVNGLTLATWGGTNTTTDTSIIIPADGTFTQFWFWLTSGSQYTSQAYLAEGTISVSLGRVRRTVIS